jgi:DNA topoisomerase-1
MKLIIVESPAKCSKIQGFLGPGHRVIATMGHIRALEESVDAVGIDRGFEPRFEFIKEKGKAIAGIKAAAAEASDVYLAADDDREGEAIAYSVCLLLKLDPRTAKRAVFHEITKPAVCKAVAEPRLLDMNKVMAQQARSMLDMMIGFTISPMLWKFVARGLSAGRCQTPALRFVCERERAIQGHKAESSWKIQGRWSARGGEFDAGLDVEIDDEENARNYLEYRRDAAGGEIVSAATKPWTESPGDPLITSTLQQAASALYHSNPKNTMKAAQRLYEAGHITYMRTDSAVLSEEAKEAARELVRGRFGEEFIGVEAAPKAPAPTKKASGGGPGMSGAGTKPLVGCETKLAQEAHEAIRPTHMELEALPEGEDWTSTERNIYRLIWLRAVQSVMAAARGEQRLVKLHADEDDEEFLWTAKWRRTTFQGWKALGLGKVHLGDESDEETDDAGAAWTAAAALQVGDRCEWKKVQAIPHTTKAVGRYTEATLVRELEKKGIGRPSTFASLIATIIDKEYVAKKDIPGREVVVKELSLERAGQWPPAETTKKRTVGAEKDRVVPTPLGFQALDFSVENFNSLFDYTFTAGMESRLDKVAAGKEAWKTLLQDTWNSYKEKLEGMKTAAGTVAAGGGKGSQTDFGDGLKAVISKKGPLLLREVEGQDTKFFGCPEGVQFADMTAEKARAFIAAKDTEGLLGVDSKGAKVFKKKGQYGWYVSCAGVNASCKEDDGLEAALAALAAKASGSASGGGQGQQQAIHKAGTIEVRNGPYGPYMFKTTLKTKKFVSVPSGLDVSKLNAGQLEAIYKSQLAAKEAAAAAGGGGGAGAGAKKFYKKKA